MELCGEPQQETCCYRWTGLWRTSLVIQGYSRESYWLVMNRLCMEYDLTVANIYLRGTDSESDLTMLQLPSLEAYAPELENANEFTRNFALVDYDEVASFTNQGYVVPPCNQSMAT